MAMRYPGGLIATSPVNAAYPSGVWTQSQTIPYASQNVWQNDQYWRNTTLLLHGDGTNGAQNNTFLDSSSNNFTITRNGNTTQGAFTPFQQSGYWSNYFDGTGDYLTLASGAAFAFGTGDFTVECFVYINSFPANPGSVYFVDARNSSQTGTWAFLTNNNGTDPTRLDWYTGSTAFTGAALTANTWSHIVYTRSSSTYAIFINGTRVATGTDSTNYNVSPTTSYIAARYSADNALNGYMSNLRVVKGSSVYSPSSSTLTIPTTPLTAITNTQLLTCQSNRFVDNSASPFTLTVYGTPSVQAFQPFPGPTTWSASVLGGSGYFDGSGDYLSTGSSTAFALGTGDFTWEAWLYRTVSATQEIYNSMTTDGLIIYISGNAAVVRRFGVADLLTSSASIDLNTWTHIAVARSGTTLSMWINGSRSAGGTTTNSTNFAQSGLRIGINDVGSSAYTGYMSNLRVVKGTAVYDPTQTSITVPTAPLTNISNTSLLLNFTNAAIIDNTAKNVLETVGNAQISTTQSKFGGASMAFDGTSDYLLAPSTPNFAFGTGDFTVEMWLYPTASFGSGGVNIVGINSSGGGLFVGGTNKIAWNLFGTGDLVAFSSFTSSYNNVWTHVAYTRSGTTGRLFINGTQQASGTDSTNYTVTTNFAIGAANNGNQAYTGYIDDLRITKGIARYTSNFTPQTSQWQDQ
jgi:hypothetical protein